jgi:hypothetical protein
VEKPLDEVSATNLVRALVEQRLLLLATKASETSLAAALAEQSFETAGEIAEWLVDQDAVVDLLASDEDIDAALAPPSPPRAAPKAPRVPPPRELESADWRWNRDGTTLTITSTTLDGVIESAREWWTRVVETASASDEEIDAILCYLEEEGLAAFGVVDPDAELEACAASENTTLPEGVRESEWCVDCHIPPAALGDDDATVLEEEPTFAMLTRAVGPKPKIPLYFWDAEWSGAIRRVG